MNTEVMRRNFGKCIDWIREEIVPYIGDEKTIIGVGVSYGSQECYAAEKLRLTSLGLEVGKSCNAWHGMHDIYFYEECGTCESASGFNERTEDYMRQNIKDKDLRTFLVKWQDTKSILLNFKERVMRENASIEDNFVV